MIKIPHQIWSIFLFFSACSDKKGKTKPIKESITESVYVSGIVKSKNQYKIYSLTNGLIDKVLVTEGDLVKKGTSSFN